MKNLLKILGIAILSSTSVTSILSSHQTINPSDPGDEGNNEYSFSVDVRDNVETDLNISIENIELIPNLQLIIKDYNHGKAPRQTSLQWEYQELLKDKPTDKSVVDVVAALLNNYIEIKGMRYYVAKVPQGFGTKQVDQAFFQAAMTYSINRGGPPLLIGNGLLPEWSEKSLQEERTFYSAVYSVETTDAVIPGNTWYGVIDLITDEENTTRHFFGRDLSTIFHNGDGYILLPTDRFNFMAKGVLIYPPVKFSFYNKNIEDASNIKIENIFQKTSIWLEAGIASFAMLKKYVAKLYFVNSYSYCSWKNESHMTDLFSWNFSESQEPNTLWIYQPYESASWFVDNESLKISAYARHAYYNRSLTIFFKITIVAEGNDRNVYIGFTLGDTWVLRFNYNDESNYA